MRTIADIIRANLDVFIEPCELYEDSSKKEKIFTCWCKYYKDKSDEMADILQALIDVCCNELVDEPGYQKFTIEVMYTNKENGDVVVISKNTTQSFLKVNLDDGIRKVTRHYCF